MNTDLYKQMVLVRVLETEIQKLCDLGEGFDAHLSTGQEAIAVGVCAALQLQDLLVVHHRMMGWALSKGVPLDLLVAELLGLPSGVCGGKAGEMHMVALKYGLAHSFQIVGTVIPVAVGVGWALKNFKKSDGIVVAVCGDAATANGQFHEGLNIAAVNKVPLLLICENNGLAGNVRPEHYQPTPSVATRMFGYGLSGEIIDGNNVEYVRFAAQQAAEQVRREQRPFMLECVCTRLSKHKQGQGDLRSKEELAELAKRDPIPREAQRLGLSQEQVDAIQAEAEQRVRAVIDLARESALA